MIEEGMSSLPATISGALWEDRCQVAGRATTMETAPADREILAMETGQEDREITIQAGQEIITVTGLLQDPAMVTIVQADPVIIMATDPLRRRGTAIIVPAGLATITATGQ